MSSRNPRGSRALPRLITQLLTGMPDRYKWLAQFSSGTRVGVLATAAD